MPPKKYKSVLLGTAVLAIMAFAPKIVKAQVIQIDGSSTVFPITEAVAEEFQKSKKGKIKVTVGIAGTGGGFKKFCRGETDISDASRPILKQEMETCKSAGIEYFELPIAYDALTVMVNPKNDWVKTLTVPDLKKMWEPSAQGKVSTWNQVRSEWPNAPLKLLARVLTRVRLTISPKLSSARPSRAEEISQRAKTTTCLFRVLPMIEMPWAILASRIMLKTKIGSKPCLSTAEKGR